MQEADWQGTQQRGRVGSGNILDLVILPGVMLSVLGSCTIWAERRRVFSMSKGFPLESLCSSRALWLGQRREGTPGVAWGGRTGSQWGSKELDLHQLPGRGSMLSRKHGHPSLDPHHHNSCFFGVPTGWQKKCNKEKKCNEEVKVQSQARGLGKWPSPVFLVVAGIFFFLQYFQPISSNEKFPPHCGCSILAN